MLGFAYEWIRTATSLITFGFSNYEFFSSSLRQDEWRVEEWTHEAMKR